MKREIPTAVVLILIAVVLAVIGFFYGRTWFQGPKEMSAKRPTNVNRPAPPAQPPAGGDYRR